MYPILFVWTNEKKKNKDNTYHLTPNIGHMHLCISICLCNLTSSPINIQYIMGPTMQVKCLEIWLLWGCGLDLEGFVHWNFGALEVSEGAFDCCKYLLWVISKNYIIAEEWNLRGIGNPVSSSWTNEATPRRSLSILTLKNAKWLELRLMQIWICKNSWTKNLGM
jgi:hypothetical protein